MKILEKKRARRSGGKRRRLLPPLLLALFFFWLPSQTSAQEAEPAPYQIAPTFFAQGQMRLEAERPGDTEEFTLFTFRRLRPGVEATLWDERVVVDAVWNFGPGSAQLIDAFADITLHPWAMLSLGQFKTPWTRYRLNSGGDQILVDWSRVTRLFGGERQRGFALGRAEDDTSGLYYSVGLFEGANARTSHGVGLSNLYRQALQDRSSLFERSSPTRVHPEVVGHIGWASKHMDATRLDDVKRGSVAVYTGMGIAHDLAPELMADATTRASGELMVKGRGLSLYVGGYLLWNELTTGGSTLGLRGGLTELTWRLTPRTALGTRYSHTLTSAPLRLDAQSVRAMQGDEGGVVAWMDEYGFGGKYDLYGESVQLTADVQLRRDGFVTEPTTQTWLGRIQAQVSF